MVIVLANNGDPEIPPGNPVESPPGTPPPDVPPGNPVEVPPPPSPAQPEPPLEIPPG